VHLFDLNKNEPRNTLLQSCGMRLILFFMLVAPFLHAQSESALRSFFEGKRVHLKIDMPATHDGVDCHVGGAPPLDFREYSKRVRQFGIALHNGEEAMITGIKVKDKNIEVQLGGGGYGVFGDDSGNVSARIVPKSKRENQLEKDLRDETDPDRREQMKRELSRLRDRRESENRYEQDEAARATAIRQREIAEKRLNAGSRFNLWYREGELKASVPKPGELMTVLAEWVDFGALNAAP
jgi:hypothetical protein